MLNFANNWTIGRRIVVGFLALGVVAAVLAFTYQRGMATLAAEHRIAADKADEALTVAEAANTGGQLYQVIADAEINMDLEGTATEWAQKRPKADATLAGLMKLAGWFAEFTPVPPLTHDQVDLLVADNVVRGGAKTLADLGIVPTAAESILPTYLDRFRVGGRYNEHAPA